jgi:hypothetical protein
MAHTPDPLKSWGALLNGFADKVAGNLHVSAIGSILSLSENRADVQLLAKLADNVSVIHHCYVLDSIQDLKVGDVVLLLFTDFPLEDFNGENQPYQITVSRRHSINDAVIVGRLR